MIVLTDLTFLILQINSAINSGEYDGISIEEVRSVIKRGDILRWLDETVDHFDASLWLDHKPEREFPKWYDERLQSIYYAYAGNEGRKWGVENRGLCLLLAWTNELIQQRQGINFQRE